MGITKKIRLFWWNEIKLQNKKKENFGDLLGKYLVEKISGKKVIWAKPSKFSILDFFQPIYVTIGSILTHVNKKSIVWGSGIVSKEYAIKKAVFLAVRGPQTRNFLVQQGYDIPRVFGDPAILLPNYYHPIIEKIYKYGIVPHYVDYDFVKNLYAEEKDILIIDLMTNNIEETTDHFLKCEKIISSSLHGIIIPHAYGIPAVWQKFSDKVFGDDIKYRDYFESVEIPVYTSSVREFKMSLNTLEKLFEKNYEMPKKEVLNKLQMGLMEVCPFS
jgi:pyruvyltransferase